MVSVAVCAAISDALLELILAKVGAKVSTTKLTVLLAAALALPETSAMAPVNTLTVAGPLSPASGVKVAV